jgi:hypothetical protein
MRSIAATFVLALAAAIACAVAGWHMLQGNFDSVFGAPPTPVGERVYTLFKPADVRHIRVSSSGTTATFALKDDGWQASAPWMDRMDPRAAVGIINFTLGMRVEDVAGVDEIDPAKAGLKESAVNIRLEDANRAPLANYKLGRVTPWKAEVEGMEQPVPTVFVQQRDKNRKRYIYACTGDINPLFKDGLKFLRDHRPFYFNPITLQKIRIRSQQGDLTLGRANPNSAWRIVKPLDFPTDPQAMKTLLEGIFELQAVKVSGRADVTLPPSDSAVKTGQIAIVPFGSETEILLEILPPETPEAKEVKATVSNRPGTVLDLPLKPEPGLISLANLPLSVNELRDPTLTHLNIQSLRGISIKPATGEEIIVSRKPPQPWMAAVGDQSFEANEENLYSLLKSVTTSRATGFESDAATDFTPWGIHRPFLTLRFLAESDEVLELRFGIDGKGGFFVNRLGTATVMRVDQALVSTIAVRPYEWRQSRLWSLDRTNLVAIERQQSREAALVLGYNDALETWTAKSDDRDLSDSLDPARANFMLSELEGLKVTRWLATDDEAALNAFANPSLTFKVREWVLDEDQNRTGFLDRTLTIAPASATANPGFYYGRMSSEAHPFLLSRGIYQKLAVDLFGK